MIVTAASSLFIFCWNSDLDWSVRRVHYLSCPNGIGSTNLSGNLDGDEGELACAEYFVREDSVVVVS